MYVGIVRMPSTGLPWNCFFSVLQMVIAISDFVRYKMPRLIAKVEGKGNGIKTVIPNMADIARALGRPPTCKRVSLKSFQVRHPSDSFCKFRSYEVFRLRIGSPDPVWSQKWSIHCQRIAWCHQVTRTSLQLHRQVFSIFMQKRCHHLSFFEHDFTGLSCVKAARTPKLS